MHKIIAIGLLISSLGSSVADVNSITSSTNGHYEATNRQQEAVNFYPAGYRYSRPAPSTQEPQQQQPQSSYNYPVPPALINQGTVPLGGYDQTKRIPAALSGQKPRNNEAATTTSFHTNNQLPAVSFSAAHQQQIATMQPTSNRYNYATPTAINYADHNCNEARDNSNAYNYARAQESSQISQQANFAATTADSLPNPKPTHMPTKSLQHRGYSYQLPEHRGIDYYGGNLLDTNSLSGHSQKPREPLAAYVGQVQSGAYNYPATTAPNLAAGGGINFAAPNFSSLQAKAALSVGRQASQAESGSFAATHPFAIMPLSSAGTAAVVVTSAGHRELNQMNFVVSGSGYAAPASSLLKGERYEQQHQQQQQQTSYANVLPDYLQMQSHSYEMKPDAAFRQASGGVVFPNQQQEQPSQEQQRQQQLRQLRQQLQQLLQQKQQQQQHQQYQPPQQQQQDQYQLSQQQQLPHQQHQEQQQQHNQYQYSQKQQQQQHQQYQPPQQQQQQQQLQQQLQQSSPAPEYSAQRPHSLYGVPNSEVPPSPAATYLPPMRDFQPPYFK